jgi:hypothetical protein
MTDFIESLKEINQELRLAKYAHIGDCKADIRQHSKWQGKCANWSMDGYCKHIAGTREHHLAGAYLKLLELAKAEGINLHDLAGDRQEYDRNIQSTGIHNIKLN